MLRDANKYIWGAKFFGAYKLNRLMMPHKVVLFPTTNCNLRCPMCVWDHEKQYPQLTYQALKPVLEELGESRVHTIRLSGGGEPLVFPGIIDLMQAAMALGFFGHLTTNGILLTPPKARKIVEMGWHHVVISVDGHLPERYEPIRGKGHFDKLVANIKGIMRLKKELHSRRPQLQISTVIMKTNYDILDKMIDFCLDLDVRMIDFAPLVEWDMVSADGQLKLNPKEIAIAEKKLEKALLHAKRNDIRTNIESILEQGYHSFDRQLNIKHCFQPWFTATILPNGDVIPCCVLYDKVMGNIQTQSFEEIWRGPRYTALRKAFGQGIFPEQCRRCDPALNVTQEEIARILRNPLALSTIQNFMGKVINFK